MQIDRHLGLRSCNLIGGLSGVARGKLAYVPVGRRGAHPRQFVQLVVHDVGVTALHQGAFSLEIAQIRAYLVQLASETGHHVVLLFVNLALGRDELRLKLLHLVPNEGLLGLQLVLGRDLLLQGIT